MFSCRIIALSSKLFLLLHVLLLLLLFLLCMSMSQNFIENMLMTASLLVIIVLNKNDFVVVS